MKKIAIIIISVCMLVLVGSCASQSKNNDAEAARPNVVIIVSDDQGWADVGYHGSPIRTPNIDKLAGGGVMLEQHYVAPMCTPTRAALLTGRYWSRFGCTVPKNERVLPWKTWTLARALKQAGYSTAITGKWHLGSLPKWGGKKFGFDHTYGSLAGGVHPWNHMYKKEPYMKTWHRNDKHIEEKGHVTDLIGDEAVKFIETDRENPFFLYVPFTAVHDPFDEPKEWLDSVSHIEEGRRQYAACTQHMDAIIGRMVEALERTGKRQNTLIIFFSDNGGTDRDGSKWYPGGRANSPIKGLNHPLRGWKMQVYEGGIRVPAFVNWPKVLKPAKVSTPVHVIDWMPTICDFLGIRQADDTNFDGVNIWPVIKGQSTPELDNREFYWQGVHRKSAAIRQGKWKLVVHRYKGSDKIELFDLLADPNEKNDLSVKFPQRIATMLKALAAQEKRDNDAVPTATD